MLAKSPAGIKKIAARCLKVKRSRGCLVDARALR